MKREQTPITITDIRDLLAEQGAVTAREIAGHLDQSNEELKQTGPLNPSSIGLVDAWLETALVGLRKEKGNPFALLTRHEADAALVASNAVKDQLKIK